MKHPETISDLVEELRRRMELEPKLAEQQIYLTDSGYVVPFYPKLTPTTKKT